MGWQMQALKAGVMAGLDVEGLEESAELSVEGMKLMAAPTGGFGYTGPGKSGLTAAGTLCMQLLGYGRAPEAVRGLAVLAEWNFDWENPAIGRPIYHWYYATQARFHGGKGTWDTWNAQFSPQLVKAQILETRPDGKEVGHWDANKEEERSYGPVYSTTFCALMLQVYYRYLPTYKKPEEATPEIQIGDPDTDIQIEILDQRG
jgi:hypothetical protein